MTDDTSNPDGYVDVPISALQSVRLRHLVSAIDHTISTGDESVTQPATTGYTEWVGAWNGSAITVGWDWAVLMSTIVLLNPSEIRTNIRVVSNDMRPEPPGRSKIHLYHWIESLPWREVGVEPILHGGPPRES